MIKIDFKVQNFKKYNPNFKYGPFQLKNGTCKLQGEGGEDNLTPAEIGSEWFKSTSNKHDVQKIEQRNYHQETHHDNPNRKLYSGALKPVECEDDIKTL